MVTAAQPAVGTGLTDPAQRVRAAYRRLAEVDRPEAWIHLRPEEDLLAEAGRLAGRQAAGEELPLAGLVVAVKNNIDVAGLPTTAACPSYDRRPDRSATAVQRLVDAGALVLGTNNLDQFATGLVGTRSPYGVVRNAWDPELVSGGSSSGSAVVVALGIADLSVATDTAGSGRVPAAFQGIVGIKPTRGLVPTTGVVPACRSYDCVTVFARDLALAELAVGIMAGVDGQDPLARRLPLDAPSAVPASPRVGVPEPAALRALSPEWAAAFAAAAQRLTGVTLVPVDLEPFLEAGRLLYGGALVAERYAAVGAFIERCRDEHPDDLDPTVAGIITAAGEVPAHRLAADQARLDELKLRTATVWEGVDALLLPTAPFHPSIAEVAADPVGVNLRLGTYTTFCTLLDLCAVAVPAGTVPIDLPFERGGGPFGVSVIAPAFHDRVAAGLARLLAGRAREESPG